MFHKEKIYNKKLRINHLLTSKTLGFMNPNHKKSQNPEHQSSRLDVQKELIDAYNQTFSKNKTLSKQSSPNKNTKYLNTQNEQTKVIYKQVNSLGNLFTRNQSQQNSPTPQKTFTNGKSKGLLIDPLSKQKKKKNKFFHAKNKEIKLISDLPQHLKRYSSLNQSSQNLSFRNLVNKQRSATFRPEENSLTNLNNENFKQKRQFSHINYDYVPLIRQQSSAKSLTKVTSILNLKPKEDKGKKALKTTAMNKYDLGYENIRLASKIMSMKPSKWCDLRQQKKFYKKQQYFKEIRSRTIEMNDGMNLNEMYESISFPKINERYHTTVQ